MHTARMWMASATPGGAPGYDESKEIGNNITHFVALTSQRLRAEHNDQNREVKGYWQNPHGCEASAVAGIGPALTVPTKKVCGCALAQIAARHRDEVADWDQLVRPFTHKATPIQFRVILIDFLCGDDHLAWRWRQ
jgi:hypothetical protein